jgi:hypothetical protein
MGKLVGLFNRPFVNLEPYIDTSAFPQLHREICLGMAQATQLTQTGGSLKWMGVCAPWVMDDGYIDFNMAIGQMSKVDFLDFVRLGGNVEQFDLNHFSDYRFGDGTPFELNEAQRRFLRFRLGAYFPWKLVFELLSEFEWDDKNQGAGKAFHPEAQRLFPQTIAFVKRLPFREIGRCLIFGLDSNDHAPAHRDTEPYSKDTVDHCISFAPNGSKQLFLSDPDREVVVDVDASVYWFNDMDYHAVRAAKSFQYSVRVDGVFHDEFYERLQRDHGNQPIIARP